MKLNPQQEKAANHIDGPCLVIAVPGSGKTRLLVERVGRMIDRGIRPQSMVCVTFTNKAADEMKDRICKRLKVSKPSCFVGTFHKLCVGLLRKFGDKIGYSEKFTILDSDDQRDTIRQIARQLQYNLEKSDAGLLCKAVNDFRENMWTRDQLDDALQLNHEWMHICDQYIERIKASNMIDFSGLLSETIRLLAENPDVLARVQDAFKYLQVDEVQDTNYAQFYLINQFSGKWNNILMVGDISQSIYRFRGARYQNIKDFLNKHTDCKCIELSLNYRSTPQIIAVADKLIRNNASHMAEKFETENKDGDDVRCLPFLNQYDEADFVSRHIQKMIREGGWIESDFAVLYRMNSMSEPIERSMANLGIQYEVIGGHSFYDRREVKDCIAMLRLGVNRKDGVAFHRLAGIVEGLGDTTIGKIEKIAVDGNMSLVAACKTFRDSVKLGKIQKAVDEIIECLDWDHSTLNAFDYLTEVVKKFKYEDFLKKEYPADSVDDRIENINQFIQSAGKFVADNPTNSVEGFLDKIALLTSNDKKAEGPKVSLMSLHGAKGLEFPVVFMVGVEQNILPHGLAVQEDEIEGLEEERRLCYVGMTRAEKHLLITYCRNRRMFGAGGSTYHKKCKPSQFLTEAGLVKEHEKIRL